MSTCRGGAIGGAGRNVQEAAGSPAEHDRRNHSGGRGPHVANKPKCRPRWREPASVTTIGCFHEQELETKRISSGTFWRWKVPAVSAPGWLNVLCLKCKFCTGFLFSCPPSTRKTASASDKQHGPKQNHRYYQRAALHRVTGKGVTSSSGSARRCLFLAKSHAEEASS